MSMSKKHFAEIAGALSGARDLVNANEIGDNANDVLNYLSVWFAEFCSADNPAFDRARFLAAAGYRFVLLYDPAGVSLRRSR